MAGVARLVGSGRRAWLKRTGCVNLLFAFIRVVVKSIVKVRVSVTKFATAIYLSQLLFFKLEIIAGVLYTMAVPENLRAPYSKKTLQGMQAERAVKRITFSRTEANPGDTLYVYAPKLNANEVLVPSSLALVFNIDLSGRHANNFLVQNVTRALVDRLHVKFGGTTLHDAAG